MTEQEIRKDERERVYKESLARRNHVTLSLQQIPLQSAVDATSIQLAFARAGITAVIGFCIDRDTDNWPITEICFGPFYVATTNENISGSASYDPEDRTYSYYMEFEGKNYFSDSIACDKVDENLIKDLENDSRRN